MKTLLIAFVAACYLYGIAVNVADGNAVPRLINLGDVDGKTYFYDNSAHYTWHTAKTYCLALNMRLATISTPAQEAFLKGRYGSMGFSGFFWIGVRDARTINQFVVDHSNASVYDVGQPWSYFGTVQTCVMYQASSSSSSNGKWFSQPCTVYDPVYVLCETT